MVSPGVEDSSWEPSDYPGETIAFGGATRRALNLSQNCRSPGFCISLVVSTLLLQIDHLPSHVIVVCATNHAELLDRAAWRRFQLRLNLDQPSRAQATKFLEATALRLGGGLGLAPRTLADRLQGASYAELEQFAQDVRRRYVLALPEGKLDQIAHTRLDQWRAQSHR